MRSSVIILLRRLPFGSGFTEVKEGTTLPHAEIILPPTPIVVTITVMPLR